MKSSAGAMVQTVSGRMFPLLDPQPNDVHWPDIVYSLAYINRFSGHVGCYSVARHTLHAIEYLDPEHRPYWLIHDAHEAYMGDITTPVTKAIGYMVERNHWMAGPSAGSAIRCLKDGIDYAIYSSVGLKWPISKEIADVIALTDKRMLMTERRDLFERVGCDGPLALAGARASSAERPLGLPWGSEYENVEPFDSIGFIANPRVTFSRFSQYVRDYFGKDIPALWTIEKDGRHDPH